MSGSTRPGRVARWTIGCALREHAPWALPMLGMALLLHSLRGSSSLDAQTQARNRAKLPKLKRQAAIEQATTAQCTADDVQQPDQEEGACEVRSETSLLLDAVQTPEALMEWFQEDEVEALQQARAGQSQLLHLLQQHGMRLLLEEAAQSDDSEGLGPDSLGDTLSQFSLPLPSAAPRRHRLRTSTAERGSTGLLEAPAAGQVPGAAAHGAHAAGADGSCSDASSSSYEDYDGEGGYMDGGDGGHYLNDGGHYLDGGLDYDLDDYSDYSVGWSESDDGVFGPLGNRERPPSARAGGANAADSTAAAAGPGRPPAAARGDSGDSSSSSRGSDRGGYYLRQRADGARENGFGAWEAGAGGDFMPYSPSPPDCDPLDFMPDFSDYIPDYEPELDYDEAFQAYGRILAANSRAAEAHGSEGQSAAADAATSGLAASAGSAGERAELDALLLALMTRTQQGGQRHSGSLLNEAELLSNSSHA